MLNEQGWLLTVALFLPLLGAGVLMCCRHRPTS